jgi:hypothetical protein
MPYFVKPGMHLADLESMHHLLLLLLPPPQVAHAC